MNSRSKTITPLPLIRQLVDKLQGAKLFTEMDLRWGYNNIRIKEDDKWKAAFICFHGAFEPLVMYFGLCNSPATLQAMLNEIFADMDDMVVVYIDDLMMYTKTDNQAEHDQIILEKMDQSKVKAILDWPVPQNVNGVRSFLGLANFYRRFIKDYAHVACPLHDLIKKEESFRWE